MPLRDETPTAAEPEPPTPSAPSHGADSDRGDTADSDRDDSRTERTDHGARTERDDGSRDDDPRTEPAGRAVRAEVSRAEPATLRRGRIAYLRCGGREPACARDAALEESLWAMLDTLPGCPRLRSERGTADVRVLFTSRGAELRFLDWGDAPLSIPALRACLEPRLGTVTRSGDLSPLTISARAHLD